LDNFRITRPLLLNGRYLKTAFFCAQAKILQ
jgi:hypothetical protein